MNKKNRLTHRQQIRIQHNHAKKISARCINEDETTSTSTPLLKGVVISRYGKLAEVEYGEQQYFRCKIRRTLPAVVTGDNVLFKLEQDEQSGVIEAILPRQTLLTRPDFYDGLKPIAANIDQIIIVTAIEPTFSLDIIDRYLVACETLNIRPLIVLNKIDLLDKIQHEHLIQQLAIYETIGYTVLFLSAQQPTSIRQLQQHLQDKTTIFVGQSGVGKSSLLIQLLPDMATTIETNIVSEHSNLGQHTTTRSQLYRLPNGGQVIDSPGVRAFGLWHLTIPEITWGFIEFRPYLANCHFRDCQHHTNNLRCGLVNALQKNAISQQRFDSYQHILKNLPSANQRRSSKK